MTDLTAPMDAPAINGTFPADDAAGQTVAAIVESEKISAGRDSFQPQPRIELITLTDEIALYDRQIRLWGVKAQEKIRTANILLVSIKALANEIAKNLVLAGIGSITLADHENVTEDDLGAQFFISDADVGKNVGHLAADSSDPHADHLAAR
jgi:ubiquitin-like 1-activating enzyme E1 A